MTTQGLARKATKTTVEKWLNSEKVQQFIARTLPENISAPRLLQVYYNLISARPELQDCTTESLLKVLIFGSQLGLSFDPHLKQAWIVPFGEIATLIIGYQGIVKLAINSGYVDRVDAIAVFQDDFFEYEEGETPKLVHRPNFKAKRDDSTYFGSYARGWKGGKVLNYLFVEKGLVEKHKAASAAVKKKRESPWDGWYIEMANKTAIRVFGGSLPQTEQSLAFHRAIAADVVGDIDPEKQNRQMLVEGFEEVIDAEVVPDKTEPEKPEGSKADKLASQLEQSGGGKKKKEKDPAPPAAEQAPAAAETKPLPSETTTTPLTEDEGQREELVVWIHANGKKMFGNIPNVELEMSAATGGKVQSVNGLREASLDQLKAIKHHFMIMAPPLSTEQPK